jgi:hypothetical protein
MRLQVGSRAVSVRRDEDGRFHLRSRARDAIRVANSPRPPRTADVVPAATEPRPPAKPPSGRPEDRRAALEELESLAQQVADAWVGDRSAVELVSEHRR